MIWVSRSFRKNCMKKVVLTTSKGLVIISIGIVRNSEIIRFSQYCEKDLLIVSDDLIVL